jgi:hypothetical protein
MMIVPFWFWINVCVRPVKRDFGEKRLRRREVFLQEATERTEKDVDEAPKIKIQAPEAIQYPKSNSVYSVPSC